MQETLEYLAQTFVLCSHVALRYQSFAHIAKDEDYPRLEEQFRILTAHYQDLGDQFLDLIQDVNAKLDQPLDQIALEIDLPLLLETSEENVNLAVNEHGYYSETFFDDAAKAAADEGAIELSALFRGLADQSKMFQDDLAKFKKKLN